MERTYNQRLLIALDPKDIAWALSWVRFLLHDVPHADSAESWPDFSKRDIEIEAALTLDAVGTTPLLYYRPHVTAARLYLGDPNLWRTRAVDGTSETRRDAEKITSAWLAQGKAIDALIPPELLPINRQGQRGTQLIRNRSVTVLPEEREWQ